MTREEFEKLKVEAASKRFDEIGLGDGGASYYGFKAGADFAWQFIERQEKELQAYRELIPKVRHNIMSVRDSLMYLLEPDDVLIERSNEALALLDEVEKV